MSIETLIAAIPHQTNDERKTMRKRALEGLQSGKAPLVNNAKKLLEAFEAFDAQQAQVYTDLIKDLADQPLTVRVLAAFQKDCPSPTEERLFQVLLDNPDKTCADLAGKIGWAPNTWDMGFGAICAQRAIFLRELSGTPAQGKSDNLPLLTLSRRDENGSIRYTMKPEAVEAFKQIGFRVRAV